ncbi:MAG: hypothetical protein ACKOYM_08740 [Actinomycetes bacterium]
MTTDPLSAAAEVSPDRVAAVEWATGLRTVRARVLDDLATGRSTLGSVLTDAGSDPMIAAIKLGKVLESLPDARKTDTRRALAELGLDGQRRLSELSVDEYSAVASRFPLQSATVIAEGRS